MPALHHQPFFTAVVALAAVVHDGPGDSITDFQRPVAGVMGYPFSELDNAAHDLLA
jgi:hypothetical protein